MNGYIFNAFMNRHMFDNHYIKFFCIQMIILLISQTYITANWDEISKKPKDLAIRIAFIVITVPLITLT